MDRSDAVGMTTATLARSAMKARSIGVSARIGFENDGVGRQFHPWSGRQTLFETGRGICSLGGIVCHSPAEWSHGRASDNWRARFLFYTMPVET
jgi:hypothetical protein